MMKVFPTEYNEILKFITFYNKLNYILDFVVFPVPMLFQKSGRVLDLKVQNELLDVNEFDAIILLSEVS